MLKNKQIEQLYAQIPGVNTDVPSEKWVTDNYVCKRNHVIKTLQRTVGSVPIVGICPICGKSNHSSFKMDLLPDRPHSFEWIRPSLDWLKRNKGKVPAEDIGHYLKGGLKLVPIQKKKDVSTD